MAVVSDPRLETFDGHLATAQNPEVEGAAQIFLESAIQFDIVDAGGVPVAQKADPLAKQGVAVGASPQLHQQLLAWIKAS